jgi:hypothetical protein
MKPCRYCVVKISVVPSFISESQSSNGLNGDL